MTTVGNIHFNSTPVPALNEIFSPATPIRDVTAFYGRKSEVTRLNEVVAEAGMHATLYGERGIGKTSLMNIVAQKNPNCHFVKLTCTEQHGFSNLWRNVLTNLEDRLPTKALAEPSAAGKAAFIKLIATTLKTTERSALSLEMLVAIFGSIRAPIVICFDEFDLAVKQATVAARFATAVKTFSDRLPQITLLMVGIANSGSELIGEHPSLERCLAQLLLRRMDTGEMQALIRGNLAKIRLTIYEETEKTLIRLTAGFPYYVHMLCKYAAESALSHRYTVITNANLKASVQKAVSHTYESIVSAYAKAIRPKPKAPPKAMYLHAALLATAARFETQLDSLLTQPLPQEMSLDAEPQFTLTELLPTFPIKAAAWGITPQQYKRTLVLALSQLSHPARGSVLEKAPKWSSSAPTAYRFKNPLFKAYILLQLYLK